MGTLKLDPKREQYAQLRAKGVGKQAAATMVGYADHNGAGAQVEESVDVQERIRNLQQEAAENAGVTKEMVIQGLVDAANIAQAQGDSTGMTTAWRELGKMLGFYAPEVKKVEKGISKSDLKRAIADMSDEDLVKVAKGRVIEGDFKRISGPEAANLPGVQEKSA